MQKEPKNELPESIQEEFDSISEPQEGIRVAVTSDMNLDGESEDAHLLAAIDKRILMFNGNHAERPELVDEVSLAERTRLDSRTIWEVASWRQKLPTSPLSF